MRLTASILAILILILSCLPCADVDAFAMDGKTTSHINVPASQNEEHHGSVDACSPFCHCSCCATFSITNKNIEVPSKAVYFSKITHTSFSSSQVIEISLPIWQPPQLA